MAEFGAKDVKALRDATGAGMMDAKKALTECDGDMEAATQMLREKGLAKAASREDRDSNDGAVALRVDGNRAAVVELKSETDFSAKSSDFVELVGALADAVLAGGAGAVADHQSAIDDLKITKKENIDLGTVELIEAADGNLLDTYLHEQDGRGTTAVVIEGSGIDAETLHEIALHIAFAKPSALSREEIDPEEVEKEKTSLLEITKAEGKPEAAWDKIVDGRIGAWFGERVLLEQGVFGEKEKVKDRVGDGSIVRFTLAAIGA